jgi:hypothetical protein
MKILVLTKDKEFTPATKIAAGLREKGHQVSVHYDNLSTVIGDFDLGISCHYRHIIKQKELDSFRYGVINIHPSLLPYGRGSDPVIWSMLNGLPTGMTIHWIDEGVDTGNILFQMHIARKGMETAEELYERIVNYYDSAFSAFWSGFSMQLEGGWTPKGAKQELLDSPLFVAKHRKDLERVGNLTGSKELMILLALSHSKYNNMYATDENGTKYNITVTIKETER